MKSCLTPNKWLAIFAAALLLSGCGDTPPEIPIAESEVVQMHCGQQWISIEYIDDDLALTLDTTTLLLQPALSASGARYESAEDDDTVFWSKGNTAQLRWRGQQYPQCVQAGTLAEPFQARGNEPFWHITLAQGQLNLRRPGQEDLTLSAQQQPVAGGQVQIRTADELLTVTVSAAVCQDTMSGMPYPYQALLRMDGKTLQGCGGSPEHLLQGAHWQVVEVLDRPLVTGSELSLFFSIDDQISGDAGCNRFSGAYTLTGEGLQIGSLVTTRRACAVSLMQQEQAFLELLSRVNGFDMTRDGQLWLLVAEQPVVLARQRGAASLRLAAGPPQSDD